MSDLLKQIGTIAEECRQQAQVYQQQHDDKQSTAHRYAASMIDNAQRILEAAQ
jgi:F0F1-type ATP synthase membrane subunit b/b'